VQTSTSRVPGIRLATMVLLVAGCGATATPAPSQAVASAPPATATSPIGEAPSATTSQQPTVAPGFVRVLFRLSLTGGGAVTATFGLDVHEVGQPSRPVYLCSAGGAAPPCRDGGSYDTTFDLPIGSTVAYRFFQELDPSGSPFHDILPKEFVVDPNSTYKATSYDVQP
jgi:hypothetical protein